MHTHKLLGCCAILMFFCLSLKAQDSTRITLMDAEKQFIDKNLTLLAEKYNISFAEAQVIQARLYDNPQIEIGGALYNPDKNKFFDIGNRQGEYEINVQQLIYLAGKRNKQIHLAQTSIALAADQFSDLLRTLRYTLRSDFFQLHYLYRSIDVYNKQLIQLEDLIKRYELLYQKKTVSLKELVRIKSLLTSLQAELLSVQSAANDTQAELQLLLQNNKTVFLPVISIQSKVDHVQDWPLQVLIDSAYQHRPDIKISKNNILYNQQNYSLQKALRVPDLTLGASFDKRGNYIDNLTMLTVGIDLPFFNRNQGNIKAAKAVVEQSKVLLQQGLHTVENEVQQAYVNASAAQASLSKLDGSIQSDYESLLNAVTQNFEKKNISLIEFIDFYDAYKQYALDNNQLTVQYLQSLEKLNYTIGKIIFNQNE